MKNTKNTKSKSNITKLPKSGLDGRSPKMMEIQIATEAYASSHRKIAAVVAQVEEKVAALQRTASIGLRPHVEEAAGRKLVLTALIDANKPLFDKPRTQVFDGIKVGLQKGKGGLAIEDEAKTIALIEKHFPDRLNELAPESWSRSISKGALENLTADDLKKLGVEIVNATDKIVIAPVEGDITSMVSALLAAAATPDQQPQAKAA